MHTEQAGNLPDRGQNQTLDLWFVSSMPYQPRYKVKSIQLVCDILQVIIDT